MRMRRNDRWRCSNAECGGEILVLANAKAFSPTNPRCSCGGLMRKPYTSPRLTTFEPEHCTEISPDDQQRMPSLLDVENVQLD